MKILRNLLIIICIVIVIILIGCFSKKQKQKTIIEKMWSHRGVNSKKEDQNTIGSIQKAKKNGFLGSEIDVFFDDKELKFIVSHDFPYNLKNGKKLYFEEIVDILEDHMLWIDLKNLNDENVNDVLNYLDKFKKYQDQFIIESQNKNISLITKKGFKTNYWITSYTQAYSNVDSSYLSCFAHFYDMNKKLLPTGKKYNIFTVNDPEKHDMYHNDDNILIVLTDLNVPSSVNNA